MVPDTRAVQARIGNFLRSCYLKASHDTVQDAEGRGRCQERRNASFEEISEEMPGESTLGAHGLLFRPPYSGYCSACGREHGLGEGNARRYCLELMQELAIRKRLDPEGSDTFADPKYSTEYLYGRARGQMFGVMEYRDEHGVHGTARAFSGQYNGMWNVPGWVPPVVDSVAMEQISAGVEKRIKDLGKKIGILEKNSSEQQLLVRKRRDMSRTLMREIHALYRVRNFCGQTRQLGDIFLGTGGMPTGTGDCCAPKLLHHAVKNHLTPLGIAEFYWGLENRSKTRQHGCFYPACEERCRKILGFMLCGLSGC